MKIKNISLPFFILASLIVLSFAFYVGAQNNTGNVFLDGDLDGLSDEEEKIYGTDPTNADTDNDSYSDGAEVRSGYNPTLPAPGDRLITPKTDPSNQEGSAVLGDATENNITENIAQKITSLTEMSANEDKEISMEDLQILIDQSLSSDIPTEDELPNITKEDLNILEQDYAKLSTQKAEAKRKEDFLDYIAAVIYIFSSNSSTPITSLTNASGMLSTITKTITVAITKQDISGLEDLMESQEKIIEQLKAVTVPEELVDTHIKALRFAMYSQELAKSIEPKADDPLGSIANLSKIEGFMSTLSSFISEIESQFTKYGISYDEALQTKLENYGIEAPENLDELNLLVK
jgi:hypothetical protein